MSDKFFFAKWFWIPLMSTAESERYRQQWSKSPIKSPQIETKNTLTAWIRHVEFFLCRCAFYILWMDQYDYHNYQLIPFIAYNSSRNLLTDIQRYDLSLFWVLINFCRSVLFRSWYLMPFLRLSFWSLAVAPLFPRKNCNLRKCLAI